MEFFVIISVAIAVAFGLVAVLLEMRKKANRPPRKSSEQRHAPHTSSAATAEARRLQNGGTIGPGQIGGGADFGPNG